MPVTLTWEALDDGSLKVGCKSQVKIVSDSACVPLAVCVCELSLYLLSNLLFLFFNFVFIALVFPK
jgi:hypothetical protein